MADGGAATHFPKPVCSSATGDLQWSVLTKWLRSNVESSYFEDAMKAWVCAIGCDAGNKTTRAALLKDVTEAAAEWAKNGGRVQPHSTISQAKSILGENGKWINDDVRLVKVLLSGELSDEAYDLLLIVLSCVTDGRQSAEYQYDTLREKHYYELMEAEAARNEAYGHSRFESEKEAEWFESETKRRRV